MLIEQLGIRGLSRRQLLRTAVAGVGFLAACQRPSKSSSSPAAQVGSERLLVLSQGDLAILTAFAAAVLPAAPAGPSYLETRVLQRIDEELYFVEEPIRADVHTALSVLEWYPFAAGHLHRFSRLDLPDRTRLIATMMSSRLETPRAIANSLRFLVHFLHYAHPATWTLTGFDGPFSHLQPQMSEQRLRYAQLTKAAV